MSQAAQRAQRLLLHVILESPCVSQGVLNINDDAGSSPVLRGPWSTGTRIGQEAAKNFKIGTTYDANSDPVLADILNSRICRIRKKK